ENGVVHYSDQPHPNAKKLSVQAAQTYKAADMPGAPGGPAAPPASAQPTPYQGCAIAQPADDQAFTNVDSLTVIVRTSPALRPGDQVFLMLDGQPVNGGVATGNQFTLTPVDRGTHTLQAVVRDSEGGLMCQTPAVMYHVHQPSILNPANPLHH
ncbi:MAG TPA: hypothetical protein VN869_03220, partial [Steroidobacteraceae bacterium]|nr:hypothetical protein [Steroidobacteraceae bacterium]